MLLSLFSNGFSTDALISLILAIPIIVFSLSFHEYSHAYVSYKLGDPTARNFGRLTLNPLKHLDPIGTVMMLLVGFGYAKPVPVNVRNFKDPKKGMALTSVAGPASNLILSVIGALLLKIFLASVRDVEVVYRSVGYYSILLTANVFYTLHYLNLALAIFNLIPLPPLDGSRILMVILPDDKYYKFMQYEHYFRIALIVLLVMSARSSFSPLSFVVGKLSDLMMNAIGLIPGL